VAASEHKSNGLGQAIKIAWTIYCLPGRILAEYWYLWSKKGQVWQSGRRRKHPFVHFFYSTVIYAVASLVVSIYLSADGRKARPSPHTASVIDRADTDKHAEHAETVESDRNLEYAPEAENMEETPDETAPNEVAASEQVVEAAMMEAFTTGAAIRVIVNGTSGYAVPSEPDHQSGCRNVDLTIDGEDHPAKSAAICP